MVTKYKHRGRYLNIHNLNVDPYIFVMYIVQLTTPNVVYQPGTITKKLNDYSQDNAVCKHLSPCVGCNLFPSNVLRRLVPLKSEYSDF